jgi:hypothetical protein
MTFFPKRYGAQKFDKSGVHKAIRTRLERGRQNQIRSVFDLALVILDECSSTFFDRTQTSNQQPQVIDQFSSAIGIVVGITMRPCGFVADTTYVHRRLNRHRHLSDYGTGRSKLGVYIGTKEISILQTSISRCSILIRKENSSEK